MALVIALNQALHGYADGHQLLASSIDLTNEQQALVLVMSDLSGPAFRSGFESYLTGYPLQNSGQYCVARTWFAPEMSRPGCVWTHTFFIRNEDLPRIQKLELLNRHFRRPRASDDMMSYEHRFFLQEVEAEITEPFDGDARPLLAALYGTSQKIVISSDNSSAHESMSLAICDQQWPRLRRNFRFCTGALSWRGSEFDLSVCPPEETHSIAGSGLVLNESPDLNRSFENWVEVAMRDLLKGGGTEYRRFLWQFGSNFINGREAFRPLTEVFELLNAPTTDEPVGEKLLSAVAHFFPQPENAHRLKSELFGLDGQFLSKLGGELAVTTMLVTHPAAAALGPDVAEIGERCADLIGTDIASATNLALLAEKFGGDNAQRYLDTYFDLALNSEEILQQAPASLLFNLLERQPALLSRPALWARLDQTDLVNRVITRFSSESALLMDAVSAMMVAQAWNAVACVVEQLGASILKRIFEIIDHTTGQYIEYPDLLYSIIWSRPSVVGGMLEHNEIGDVSLKMLTAEIDPRSWHVRRIGVTKWQSVVKTEIQFRDQQRILNSAIFLLSIGLSSRAKGAVSLVADSFATVYSATTEDRLDGVLWDRLEPSLTWYSPSRGKGARLVHTVARAFKDRDWPIKYFAKVFITDEQFFRALADLDEMWRGDRYIRRLMDAAQDGEFEWSASQLKAFKRFI